MYKQVVMIGLAGVWVSPAWAGDLTLNLGPDSTERGRVQVELVGSEAAWANSLVVRVVGGPAFSGNGVVVPTLGGTAIPLSGCNLEPAVSLPPGVFLLSEKKAGLLATPPDLTPTQRGCRVDLNFIDGDGDVHSTFPNGSVLRFSMCSQTDGDPACEHVWSSNNADNGADAAQQFQWFSWSPGHPCYYNIDDPSTYDAAGCQRAPGEHVITTEIEPNSAWRMEWEDLPWGTDGPYGDFDDIIVNVRVEIDSDGDGLFDDWELAGGIDIDRNGTLDVMLPGAHVNEKDIYLHLDYMSCSAPNTSPTVSGTTYSFPNVFCPGGIHTHVPSPTVLTALTQAFLEVPAPEGPIHLHIDPVMSPVPHTQWMTIKFGDAGCGSPSCPDPNLPCTTCTEANAGVGQNSCIRSFDEYKKAYFGNNNPKRYAYHYGIIGHRMAPSAQNTGCGEMPGNDFYISVGGNTTDGLGTDQEIAGTIMHELGHNLYLAHGGNPEGPEAMMKYKPNYPSVMSYTFQKDGLVGVAGSGGLTSVSYSHGTLAPVSEASLLETANLWPAHPGQTRWIVNNGVTFTGYSNFAGGKDWNQSGGPFQGVAYAQSIDDDALANETFSDHDDWANLRFEFQNTGDFEDGVHENSVPGGEASFAETHPPVSDAGFVADGNPNSIGDLYACYLGEVESLDGSGSYDVAGGSIASYSWSWDDPHTEDASGAIAAYACTSRLGAVPLYLTVTDDDGVSTIDSSPLQVTLNAGQDQTLECTSPAGVSFTVGTSPPLPGGGFSYDWTDTGSSIGSTAQVTHTFSIASHDVSVTATDIAAPIGDVSQSDSLVIVVEDTTPPVIEGVLPSSPNLWPPNHTMIDVTFAVSVHDVCDPSPTCRITEMTSNEPETGCGSGVFTPDTVLTGPLTAQFRAERCGAGDGRVYTVSIECEDDYGNSAGTTTEVAVRQECNCH